MVDRAIDEALAHGEPGMPGTDDGSGNPANGSGLSAHRSAHLLHRDSDVGRIGDNIEDRRALLRLATNGFFLRCCQCDEQGELAYQGTGLLHTNSVSRNWPAVFIPAVQPTAYYR